MVGAPAPSVMICTVQINEGWFTDITAVGLSPDYRPTAVGFTDQRRRV